jgi:hypothetical protein
MQSYAPATLGELRNRAGGQPFFANTTLWVVLTLLIWALATAVCWVGYTGEDDFFYARYAYLFHRPPIVWWEFRMPAILAIRTSFLIFGPTEFAAAIPSLLASLAILGAVAWVVEWPRRLTWQSQSAMLLAALIPIDVAFRSYPSANQIAAGMLAFGSACILKGSRRVQICGAALLAGGFITHELSLFYIALFCLTLIAFDARRFWRPVAWCIALSGALVLVESTTYAVIIGDPLARLRTTAGATTNFQAGVDPDTGINGLRFFLWPLQILILSKQFGVDLLLLLITGIIAWRRLTPEQRILLVVTFAVFLYLGYGSTVPWAYRPLNREFHYYNTLSLGVAALLPFTLGYALARRQLAAKALVIGAIAVHVLSLAATGRWGANVGVSRELLRHARLHPEQEFVTDVNTMNQMYVLNGFRMPDNVICVNGDAVDRHLLINKEPPGTPRFRFPERRRIDAALVNREQGDVHPFEPEFSNVLRGSVGERTPVVRDRYRRAFLPLTPLVGTRGFMLLSHGGDMVMMPHGTTSSAVATAVNGREQ